MLIASCFSQRLFINAAQVLLFLNITLSYSRVLVRKGAFGGEEGEESSFV